MLIPVNKILEKQKSKIQKIQVVNWSIVVLLENGFLFSWGDNSSGNLGQSRSILETIDIIVDKP